MARRVRTVLAVVAAMLVVPAPATAADPAHDPTVKCSAYVRSDGVIVFAGAAHATAGHVPVVETTVRCSYTAVNGRYTSANTSPGPVVWTYTRGSLNGAIVVCESATAVYADGHVGHVPERCGHAEAPQPLPDGEFTPAVGGCHSTRQQQRWVILAYGVAPVRAAPPVSTSVWCTLTDIDGHETRSEEPAAAGFSISADALPGPFQQLATRCWGMFALYADGSTYTGGACEPT